MTDLLSDIRARKRELEVREGQKTMLQERQANLQNDISELKELSVVLDKVTILLNRIGEDKQQQAQEQIEGIVTRGLQTIFGPTFSFHIIQSMKGKSASVEFVIRTYMDDSVVETPVLESHGGGLAAIVGFLLRVTVLLLDKTKTAKVLILDETFGMVSNEYLDPLAEFVRELVDRTNLQVILVTHQPEEWSTYADKVVRFGIKNGATYVREES